MDVYAHDTIRRMKSRKRSEVVAMLALQLPLQVIADLIRIMYLIKLKFSREKYLFIVSNQNHINNILKYVPELQHDYATLHVKKVKSFTSVPISYLLVTGILRILFCKKFRRAKLSSLDVADACYFNSNSYLSWVFKFLNYKYSFISREDITPYIEVAKALQKNKFRLITVEHGIFVRNYESFDSSSTTWHIFSSQEIASLRTPKSKQVIRVRNPIQDLYQDFISQDLPKFHNEILLADTHNIRPHLVEISEKLKRDSNVCLRFHPGQQMTDINGVRVSRDKVYDLKAAKLVVTGTSGFALEAALCGIPTIIITDKSVTWMANSLKIFTNFANVLMIDYEDFMMLELSSISLESLSAIEIKEIHERYFFSQPNTVKRGKVLEYLCT